MRCHPDVIWQHEAIFVMDDDIAVRANNISRLFRIREKFDLWVLQHEGMKILGQVRGSLIHQLLSWTSVLRTGFGQCGGGRFQGPGRRGS